MFFMQMDIGQGYKRKLPICTCFKHETCSLQDQADTAGGTDREVEVGVLATRRRVLGAGQRNSEQQHLRHRVGHAGVILHSLHRLASLFFFLQTNAFSHQ